MNSVAIDDVWFNVECKKCHVRNQVRAYETARDGAVTLYRAKDQSYCSCGGLNTTEFQIAITADPARQPVVKIVPAVEMRP